jgi:alkanesulfonate monooxygenase SsuD/methylene tetrahydromethanopterin reductase-like flavin-dependent oxidoreductase (luciferase family)
LNEGAPVQFGVNFFPSVGPAEMPAARYWQEALDLAAHADGLGYHHVRAVEHYFEPYGGYSPSPIVFLAAAAQRTKRARLITGAVLPVFNHPLKLAGEIGMLDAISGGRLEVGFARAFLPHEFDRFGRSLDESRARFDEGVAQVRRLLAEENVTEEGRFHRYRNVTSLPRPTQRPAPPFWIAASATAETFVAAGRAGYAIMCIPLAAAKMSELIGQYREAWRAAGHAGHGRVMLAFSMCCMPTSGEAVAAYRARIDGYMAALAAAASGWTAGIASKDYAGYDKMVAAIKAETFDSQRAKGTCWAGSPAELRAMIADYRRKVPFEVASLQVNQHGLPLEEARRSLALFAAEVMPHFAASATPPSSSAADRARGAAP